MAKHDPNVTGYLAKVVSLRAAEPDFKGQELASSWRFDGRSYVGEVVVANPGDQPVPLAWSLTSPASWILPDFSWATTPEHPDWRHRERVVALPFQRWHHDPARRQDALVRTGVNDLQGIALDGHQFQARWAGQSFLYMVPPGTPPTTLPVAINPLPWSADIWRKLKLPGALPADVLFKLARSVSTVLEPVPEETVLSWSPERLVKKIDDAVSMIVPDVLETWTEAIRTALSLPSAGELIATTYGSVANMAGATCKVYTTPLYETPWEV
ncbi:hypothetical protein [Corynebacterium sp. TAE3-ERU2]|uniref:hypothetical protein n=1 Tax=Corynebacterium sp. TAE3-ERU2 TaxID=2849497 RepID=UPI001C43E879|nr:hypothetical protein [Corynebacterium sp. TAE3-ERU2]MBV7302935.1 hypothetical protein [Corynebacterium sp. TAE3-ERU2]